MWTFGPGLPSRAAQLRFDWHDAGWTQQIAICSAGAGGGGRQMQAFSRVSLLDT